MKLGVAGIALGVARTTRGVAGTVLGVVRRGMATPGRFAGRRFRMFFWLTPRFDPVTILSPLRRDPELQTP
jgi:hypothetical protein